MLFDLLFGRLSLFKNLFGFGIGPLALALLLGGSAAAGGAGGFFGARSRNRGLRSLRGVLGADLPSFSGQRPPGVTDLRGIEAAISQILKQRAAGQDVGFDPARLTALKEQFDIGQGRQLKESQARTINELSGTGQSRNLAARQATLGRQRELAGEARRQTFLGFDIEDLTARQQERDVNTERLARFNRFQFGQENIGSQFDLNQFQIETSNELRRRGLLAGVPLNVSPTGSAIESGVGAGTAVGSLFLPRPTPRSATTFGGDPGVPTGGQASFLQAQQERENQKKRALGIR